MSAYDVETVSLGDGRTTSLGAGGPFDEEVAALIAHVDEIAEIPNSIRNGTEVRLVGR